MMEFSRETETEHPDAGRIALSESKQTTDSGGGSGGGESLGDLRMPAEAQGLREEAQLENRNESQVDAMEGKGSGEAGPDNNPSEQEQGEYRGEAQNDTLEEMTGTGDDRPVNEQGQTENRAEPQIDKFAEEQSGRPEQDGQPGGALNDLRMPAESQGFLEDAQLENLGESRFDVLEGKPEEPEKAESDFKAGTEVNGSPEQAELLALEPAGNPAEAITEASEDPHSSFEVRFSDGDSLQFNIGEDGSVQGFKSPPDPSTYEAGFQSPHEAFAFAQEVDQGARVKDRMDQAMTEDSGLGAIAGTLEAGNSPDSNSGFQEFATEVYGNHAYTDRYMPESDGDDPGSPGAHEVPKSKSDSLDPLEVNDAAAKSQQVEAPQTEEVGEGGKAPDELPQGASPSELEMPVEAVSLREEALVENGAEPFDGGQNSSRENDEPAGYADWRESEFGQGSEADSQASPEADPDEDGHDNREEFRDGTDPRSTEKGSEVTSLRNASENPADDALKEE